MKIPVTIILLALMACYSCNRSEDDPLNGFIQYDIPAGKQYSVDSTNIVLFLDKSELKFQFRFDSSAVYTTAHPANQGDINKLYGFADCVSGSQAYTIAPHHIHSARFGWAWYNNALRIYSYCYSDSVRLSGEIGTVAIGSVNSASIRILPAGYEFKLNDHTDTVERSCTSATVTGYKLFPYFGGTETAPHAIRIWIREQ